MKQPIAFVTNIEREEVDQWLELFSEVMPEEESVPFDQVTDLTAIEIAIVANPRPEDLLKLPNLKWIQSLWAGVEGILKEKSLDHIPLARMTDPNLAVTMAEAVLAWTLYLHRDMPKYAEQQQARIWKQQPFVRAEERSVGILGLGKLGLRSAETLLAAGFKVLGWSRSLKNIDGVETFAGDKGLNNILNQSDIVVNLLPHTPSTWNLLNEETFGQMKAGASLINFGRGATVEPNSLIAALDSGHLKHAVLDVFKKEPLPDDNALWVHPKVTILPHISAPTDPKTASQLVADNIKSYRSSGTIPTVVDRSLGY
ncbi:MAG: 2-hydroxyacid dehydrogenase [Kordiimonas sp.]